MLRSSISAERGTFGDAENFEIEGDGPLGITFRAQDDGSIVIRQVVRETAAAETHGLLDGMQLLCVEGEDAPAMGYHHAMHLMCVHPPAPCSRHTHLFHLSTNQNLRTCLAPHALVFTADLGLA